ncbi:MAG: type II toxin-antitoxin system RelE/ParE family toxin [Eubacteriales bacterium]|nr:type II toxin-antitoxin system RelE/ParE family toxin [Eubacteriales bacterium]
MKKIIAYKGYYVKFMDSLSEDERLKIRRSLLLLENDGEIPSRYIKFIRDGIWEYRVSHLRKEFRLLYFYDGQTIIILLNCFLKKTQKTPLQEIEKAIKLKKEYYEQK